MQAYPDIKERNKRSSRLTLETPDLFLLNSEKCLHKVKALEIRSRPAVLKGKVAHVSGSQHEFLPDVFLHAEVSLPSPEVRRPYPDRLPAADVGETRRQGWPEERRITIASRPQMSRSVNCIGVSSVCEFSPEWLTLISRPFSSRLCYSPGSTLDAYCFSCMIY